MQLASWLTIFGSLEDGGAGLESLGIYGNGGLGLPSFIPGDAAPPSDPIYTASSPFVSGANFQ